jgi:serine/threonine-protein kinase PpkA
VRLQVRYGENRHRVVLARASAPLVVSTDPADANLTVRYANVPGGAAGRHAHRSGSSLPTGPVEVWATAMGRRSAYRRVDLGSGGARLHLELPPMSVEPGSRMRDPLATGGEGPEMVVLPAGQFQMGQADGPPSERPVRRVVFTQPFAVSVHEVTHGEFLRFDSSHETAGEPTAPTLPVSRVDFDQAVAYAAWLSDQTGERYRLPSEAEWEYLARAGSVGEFWYGDDPAGLCAYGNVADRALHRRLRAYETVDCDDGFEERAPVGSFPANAFGVRDVHGNVAEWVLDCGLPAYAGASDDGAPLDEGSDCPTHGVRGGSWSTSAADTRLAKRNIASSASPDRGIRLVREL